MTRALLATLAAAAAVLVTGAKPPVARVAPVVAGGAPVPAAAIAHPDAPPRDAAIERRLAAMTVREKAAQLVMPWVPGGLRPGTAAWRRAERLVVAHGVGGLIVGKGDRAATARALARLQARSATPLLVAADLEWGAGMRLLGATLLPTAMAVAATGDTALAYAHGRLTAAEARAAGVHVALAPVLDVNVDPRNPVINTRAFGEDPRAVAAFGTATVRGLQDGGLLAVAKHFPGHGDTDQDSHLTLPVVGASRARLDTVELAPFRAAVRGGIAGVLVGHVAVPALTGDRTPASLSPVAVDSTLRGALGFDGLVFTDALTMAGATAAGRPGDVAVRAVRAGADVLLQPTDAADAVAAIVAAVAAGVIPEARLDASVRRVLRAKARLGLVAGAAPAARRPDAPAIPARTLADSIARRSITLVDDPRRLLPLRRDGRVVSIVYAGSAAAARQARTFDAALGARGLDVRRRTVTAGSVGRLVDSLVGAWGGGTAAGPPTVVVSVYQQALPWRGVLGLPAPVAAALERLARRAPVVLVAFGDPYVVGDVTSAAASVLAWSGTVSAQRAAAAALLGEIPVTGRSPVTLPPRWERGRGVRRDAAGPR